MITTTHGEQGHQYYDSIYARGYATHNYYPLYRHVLQMIEQESTPRRVLEIGCGVGDLGRMIIEHAHAYRGFDFSPVAVECSRKLCPTADFRVGDAYDPASYLPHDYDTAVALEVLEHLDDFKLIENIPAGVRLIASVPDYDDVAHLRLYKDPERDIIERFSSLLHVSRIISLAGKGETGEPKTIYLFQGTRVSTEAERGRRDAERRRDLPATTQADRFLRPVKNGTCNDDSGDPHGKIGRNDLCPCGSGRKYKKCCLG